MTAPTFSEFMNAVDGHGPFPWQQRLYDAFISGLLPDAVIVPTGLGKTAVLDAWLFALATRAHTTHVPRRLMFVVNRRIIVDGAYERALKLKEALEVPSTDQTQWARDQLIAITNGNSPLEVVRMRGGVSWDSRWLERPDQPAIVCGTVDQFGSRALFRGYGVWPTRRSMDAALAITDALIVIDEAHLSEPLCQTVTSIAEFEAEAAEPVLPGRSLHLIRMTATAAALPAIRPIRIEDDDRSHPVAAERMAAHKPAKLIDASTIKDAATTGMAPVFGQAAFELLGQVPQEVASPAAVIVVNTIELARAVHRWVESHDSYDCELVIGRCRPFIRDLRTSEWMRKIRAGRDRTREARPFVLVATQTIEVGADLDADVLVTEAAPLDALIQRFGRLDRLGELSTKHGRASAAIIWAKSRHGETDDSKCVVYGAPTTRTWNQLAAAAGTTGTANLAKNKMPTIQWPTSEIGFGPDELADLVASFATPPEDLVAKRLDAPVMLRRTVLDWARTHPAPSPDRPITSYLHGPGRGSPQVDVFWRAGIATDEKNAIEWLKILPPTAGEIVSVPVWQLQQFLSGRTISHSSDLESEMQVLEADAVPTSNRRVVECLVRRDNGWRRLSNAEDDVRAGDLVVLDTSVGGHDKYGWNPEYADLVPDIADLVARKNALRLRLYKPSLVAFGVFEHDDPKVQEAFTQLTNGAPVGETVEKLLAALRENTLREIDRCRDDIDGNDHEERRVLLEQLNDALNAFAGCRIIEDGQLDDFKVRFTSKTDDATVGTTRSHMLLTRRRSRPKDSGQAKSVDRQKPVVIVSDDDDESSFTSTGGVLLSVHLDAVMKRACEFATSLNLSEALVRAVALAAGTHDLGKADVRFQTILRDGDWAAAEIEDGSDNMWAKSAPTKNGVPPKSTGPTGWPRGMRHEAVSVALLNSADAGFFEPGIDPELVRHLVASHHGRARPLFPAISDRRPSEVSVTHMGTEFRAKSSDAVIDWDQPERFDKLCRKYGAWGLSLLETIVRLADIAVSEEGS